jgi:HK97 family phage major capsid protein
MSDVIEVKAEGIGEVPATDTEMAALREEVAGLKARVEAGALRAGRAPLDGIKSGGGGSAGRSAFVERYLRRGLDAGVEMKSVTGATGPDGGFAVPREIDEAIETLLKSISPIRAIASVVATGSAGYRKLVAAGGTPSGWASETAPRPETATPVFSEIAPPSGTLYANPAASQAMLEDAAFDLEGWLSDEVAREFARAEGEAFVRGTGVNRPRGFVTYPTTAEADGVRAFGTLQHVASGAAGAFAATNAGDRLVDLVHALRAPYRQGAVWGDGVRHAGADPQAQDNGRGLYLAACIVGGPTGEPAGLSGGRGGRHAGGGGRQPVNRLRQFPRRLHDRGIGARRASCGDPYSNKPFVHFYATKRVGGAVVNSEAIKLMRFSAT